ncbi:CvpA family protein [Enterococcus caccae]|uniref:Colicin V production family protein n=1 Tax=Enterococcus caccae ATCC BAA-1240 TaxID=1158612 RepID=R3WMY4_9ENTE|nr:CvpA family protein [Enterococcus caccae]EOL43220.1 colicin V production family protein [Enterococcus caccae ATCC BAA-1240]EOT68380.1 colicin V production family protein [Enterococcus caccae ATCC BAA-1240]OJG26867.1 colicin V production family protein [Enterococcus caccae]
MLTLLILLLLAIGFYTGARRGLILQVLYTFGYLVSYFIAKSYYKSLASHLELFIPYPSPTADTKLVFFNQEITLDLDQAFYGAVAFLLIVVAGWLVVRFLAIFAHGLVFIPVLKQANWLAGGLISLVVIYVGIFLVLSMLSMVPVDAVQNQFKNSGLASYIVKYTPIFSKQIYHLWIEQMIK